LTAIRSMIAKGGQGILMTETIKEEHARLVKEERLKVINDVVDLDPAFWDFLVGWMSNHHLEEMVLAAKKYREIYKL